MSSNKPYDVEDPTEDGLKATRFNQQIFTKPVRTADDLKKWKRSHAYYDVITYINNTSMAIQGHRQNGTDFIVSHQMSKLCKVFNWLDRMVHECHPLGIGHGMLRCVGEDKINLMDSTMSLRNKCHHAFRQWMKLVQEKVYSILERQVKPNCKYINELAQYLTRSFGSLQHYDYGPGHELMFIFYLCSLFKSGILIAEDTVAAALLLYQRYLDLVRRLASFFRLATSQPHDNNIVDDRNVLPYIWGCAQLCRNHPFIPPQWEQPAIMEQYRNNYMLLSSLEHLQKKMNYKALGVHSYQLWCVLSLSNWPDAYTGLMDTYMKHVLNDFYTVQDLVFCEMLSFTRQPLEYLQQAFLGDPPPLDTSSSSTYDSEEDVEEQEEEEDDSEAEQLLLESRHIQAIEKKKKLDDKTKILFSACAPLPLHRALKTDVFLGFKDPHKLEKDSEEKYVGLLRRAPYQSDRTQHAALHIANNQKKSSSIDSELGVKKTSSPSDMTYYTI